MIQPEPLRAICAQCPDTAAGYDRVELERWSVWHTYMCHIDVWEATIGRRPPLDPQPTPGSIVTSAPPGTRGQLAAPIAESKEN